MAEEVITTTISQSQKEEEEEADPGIVIILAANDAIHNVLDLPSVGAMHNLKQGKSITK